jgi:aspartate racemase
VLYSVDFQEIERLQRSGDWNTAGAMLADAARALEAAGAEAIVLCANTMHKVTYHIEAAVDIPVLHIADATATRIKAAHVRRVGLLGTRYTMEQEFYKERLRERHGLDVLVPSASDRETVNRIIFEELCLGEVREASRAEYRRVMADLVAQGAKGIIYGCTEIPMLVGPEDCTVPTFDTTTIHAAYAVDWALEPAVRGWR